MAKKPEIPKEAWVTIDPETLNPKQKKAYDAYKEDYKVMKEGRQAFEDEMQIGLPQGKRLAFGYNFGKLAIAVVDDDGTVKAKKGPLSYTDFLAQQQQGQDASEDNDATSLADKRIQRMQQKKA